MHFLCTCIFNLHVHVHLVVSYTKEPKRVKKFIKQLAFGKGDILCMQCHHVCILSRIVVYTLLDVIQHTCCSQLCRHQYCFGAVSYILQVKNVTTYYGCLHFFFNFFWLAQCRYCPFPYFLNVNHQGTLQINTSYGNNLFFTEKYIERSLDYRSVSVVSFVSM